MMVLLVRYADLFTLLVVGGAGHARSTMVHYDSLTIGGTRVVHKYRPLIMWHEAIMQR